MKLINVVLATYKPNFLYFTKLLRSLNEQTYPNIKLTIIDDSDDFSVFSNIYTLVSKEIRKFEFSIDKNKKNLGSNRTFEILTEISQGDYIAYCDQDDIWEKEKLNKLVSTLEKEKAVLCYSDLSIIDENDIFVANSFKNINKRLKHLFGDNLFEYFLRRNSVTGCTMLIKSKVAKSAIPFCRDFYVHDHWLALFTSMQGTIAYVNEPLVRYRIHGNNQIGATMLKGINNREDYINKKLLKEQEKYEYLLKSYEFESDQRKHIEKVKAWTEKRVTFFESKNIHNTISMFRNLTYDWQLIVFELLINLAPEGVSEKVLVKIKR